LKVRNDGGYTGLRRQNMAKEGDREVHGDTGKMDAKNVGKKENGSTVAGLTLQKKKEGEISGQERGGDDCGPTKKRPNRC